MFWNETQNRFRVHDRDVYQKTFTDFQRLYESNTNLIKSSFLSSWVEVKTGLFAHISCLFFNCVKITQNVASLNFSAQNCRFTTVYKDVPSAPSVGPPAVAPSARNELQKITQTRLKTGFECMTVIFLKRKKFKIYRRKNKSDIN